MQCSVINILRIWVKVLNSDNSKKKLCLIWYIRSGLYSLFHLLSNQKYFGFRSNCQSNVRSMQLLLTLENKNTLSLLSILIQGRLIVLPYCTAQSFFFGGFITAIVVNPPERKLAKRTSVQCTAFQILPLIDC